MTPNIIIFRIPDVDGSKTFVQLDLAETGQLSDENACEFNVVDGDSFNLLGFNHIVLGLLSEDNEGSLELARVEIKGKDGAEVEVHTDPFQLQLMAIHLMQEWNSGAIEGADTE